ncbi:MAG: hypothetical protein JWR04_498 [Rhodoglobus sp.]|nr:hypothetical protein [Rhodoglobus sp.]
MTTTAPDTTTTTAPVAPASITDDKAFSIASLVLGIGSIVMGFQPIVAAAGLVLGIMALRRESTGRAMAIAGIITSSVSLAGIVIGAAAFAAFLPFLAVAGFWGFGW